MDKKEISIYSDSDSDENNNLKIVFDHHGLNENKNNFFYYEPYGSLSGTNALLNSLQRMKEENNWLFQKICYEIIDAVQLRCVILDERIQEEAENPDRQKQNKKLREILENMGIFVPPCDDSMGGFDLYAKKLPSTEMLFDWINKIDPPTKYVLVHLTLIEKLQHSTNTIEIQKWIEKFNNKFETRKLIIISGRGTPSNLPNGVLFLPYSIISRYILEDRSKFHIAKLLYSARRREE